VGKSDSRCPEVVVLELPRTIFYTGRFLLVVNRPISGRVPKVLPLRDCRSFQKISATRVHSYTIAQHYIARNMPGLLRLHSRPTKGLTAKARTGAFKGTIGRICPRKCVYPSANKLPLGQMQAPTTTKCLNLMLRIRLRMETASFPALIVERVLFVWTPTLSCCAV
jgi:hypothetical protein